MKPRAAWALALLLSLPAIARADTSPPRIAHTAITRAPLGAAIVVSCEITDDSAIFAPSLLVRPKGAKEFDTLELKSAGGSSYQATIPAEQVTGDLEYLIEAFDEAGNGPARVGSPEAPLLIHAFDPATEPPPPIPVVSAEPAPPQVAPPASEPAGGGGGVHTKWWFWTLIAAGVAGGAIAVAVAASGGTPSIVDLQIQGPDPTQGR